MWYIKHSSSFTPPSRSNTILSHLGHLMLVPAEDEVLEGLDPRPQPEADHTWTSRGQLLLHLLRPQVSASVIISAQRDGTSATLTH